MNDSGDSNNDGDGEDQEGSSNSKKTSVEDALTSFREQWQRELEISPQHEPNKIPTPVLNTEAPDDDTTNIENRAKSLFLKGIEYEQSRKFYEAIQFYKRAVTLIPDIEFRLYESTKLKTRDRFEEDKDEQIENDLFSSNEKDEDDNEDEKTDLLAKLSRIVNRNQWVCTPKFQQSTTHISALPMEIVFYILRWVVSSELDLRSLEMFSRVCRGFYVSARDSEIWRLACVRAWGVNCGNFGPKYQSWRDMYIQRPRMRYNGCYISKTTYIRHGENSFQDQFYRPWHLVEYFRYLRFFPEGRVLMLTSTDEAQSCVTALKYRIPRNASVLIGHYRLHDNSVMLVLKKQETKGNGNTIVPRRKKRGEAIHDSGEQAFHVQFDIQNHHRKRNSQLAWMSYNIFTKYRNGQEGTTCLSLGARYPPLKFSRVKSYTQDSEAPLQ
ncbi:F-box only protein 9 [Prorops nasuta]|uniref:F-box only protein 9 n=1 Tax=Prorops nasuta TaxID=863751 RepID=UPI0034CD7A42